MNTQLERLAFPDAWDEWAQRANAPLAAEAVDAARRSWFDTASAMAAGSVEGCTRAAANACGGGGGDEVALGAADAALVLGTASHALDYDDVSMLATCHPSAPPVAALLAMLPVLERRRPGIALHDLLAAYVLGTQTTLRLGQWLGFRHYALGFHATSTLGTVGVAAAAAHALRLTPVEAHAALSIAASSACGLRANFGTDSKPLHVGFAAAAGVRAALLAQAGATASDEVWGPTGFALAFNGGEVPVIAPWLASSEWAIVQPGFEHKRFPSCYMTHRMIAGVLKLRERHPRYTGPVRIEIEVPRNGLSALKHPRPVTGLQAKFSGPYCAAAAWVDGRVQLGSFADEAIGRAPVQAQMRLISLRERDDSRESLDSAPVEVRVHCADWADRIIVDWAPGSPADPMTREELVQKWRDCARHGGIQDDAAAIVLFDAPLDQGATATLAGLRDVLLSAATRPRG